jgi:Uma2 family endonuclease
MTTLANRILASSDAVLVLQQVQKVLNDEAQRRHQFREWIDESQKAEFINGQPVLHSPVKRAHWKVSDLLSRLLSVYASFKKLGVVGVEKVMISLTRNDYEPDICFFANDKAQYFKNDQVLFPAPDFVVEILSKRTAKNDKTIKKQDYALHGIKEYWIIDPAKQTIEQYILPSSATADSYFPAKTLSRGQDIESYAIAGFIIPIDAIFDEQTNIQTLQKLIEQ